MKKGLVCVLCLVLLLTLFGCSNTPSSVSNDDAGNAVKKALTARWTYQEDSAFITTKNAGEENAASTAAELEAVIDLKDADFEDKQMKQYVSDYIAVLEKQMDLFEKYDGDFWTLQYNNMILRRDRQEAIKNIMDNSSVEFEGESKKNYDSLMDVSEFDNLSEDAQIVDSVFTIEESKSEKDEWGYRVVQFKVKNNTGYSFPEFALMYRVKSSDGTTINSQLYDFIHNFEAESTTWTEDIGYDLEEGYTVEVYAYIAGVETGSIENESKLKEPFVLTIE